jgi:hypothetical protein
MHIQRPTVIKRYARRRVVTVVHRVVRGTATALARTLNATGGGTVINTASIERLNATLVSALAPLAHRRRAIARTEAVLTAGMYRVGVPTTKVPRLPWVASKRPGRPPKQKPQPLMAMAA